jgi:hypothetical protein
MCHEHSAAVWQLAFEVEAKLNSQPAIFPKEGTQNGTIPSQRQIISTSRSPPNRVGI